MENPKEPTILKDSEWSMIDSEPCRVIHFSPFATFENGKIKSINLTMPYCAIRIECPGFSGKATGFICHKIDFTNLWRVFKDRGVTEEEEVIVYWTTKHYKNKFLKHFSFGTPKLLIWICRKNTYEVLTDPKRRELDGNAWFDAIKPIEVIKPDVME
jgi:hypothetical protein